MAGTRGERHRVPLVVESRLGRWSPKSLWVTLVSQAECPSGYRTEQRQAVSGAVRYQSRVIRVCAS
jgi:hypothetical protein